ncbi:MAG: DUF402 domain-containing protein [Chloroflexota bacterium]|nr:DUF402 domain-containing protein [Chloroflexota bacterium]
MITVIKQDTQGKTKISYSGKVINYLPDGVVIQASWTLPAKNLGYTVFEPGDRFIEYYYTDRWFNIFDIATAEGVRKGWYCNIAEPAVIYAEHIKQIDLLLDVWVAPDGKTLVLDEDEFAADTTLTQEQRRGAEQGLQSLLEMIESRQEMFANIVKR